MNIAEATARVEQLLKDANPAAGATGTRVDVFVGEPKAVIDSDSKAHAYLAIFPTPGVLNPTEEDLAGSGGPRGWRFQLIAAGGDVARALKAIQRAHDVLLARPLDPSTGIVREDGDGGPIRQDTTVSPPRWFAPLLLAVDL